jgi:hypothetical protein
MDKGPGEPVHMIVHFSFPDQLAADQGMSEALQRMAEVARSVGATLLPQEAAASHLSRDELLLASFESRLDPELDLFDADIQRRLETPLAQLLRREKGSPDKSMCTRLARKLEDDSIVSARDVFTGGFAQVHGASGVGTEMIATLRSELEKLLPEIPLISDSTPAIAAKFCNSLDQIVFYYGQQRITVAELVACPDEQTAAKRYDVSSHGYAEARDYATKFEAAKQSNHTQ